jgi:outer membrane protein assembly factor BamB
MTLPGTTNRITASLIVALSISLAVPVVAAERAPNSSPEEARRILDATGTEGGLVVHLGCGDAELTVELSASDGYLIHGLDADADNVRRAREYVRSKGLYGRVSIDRQVGRRLPYADNLVNLVVAETLYQVPADEVMRVLRPGGAAYLRQGGSWKKTLKPYPHEIDEWTHTLHSADGNAVARDSVVGPPRHIQWVGEPESARQHERLASISAVVSAGGRLFSIQDEGSVASILLPAKWFLVGRDAFNGVILWKRPILEWEDHLRDFRMGPANLARRLVAVEDKVYVTLGYGEGLSVLDAASGETLETHQETDGTTEIVYSQGVLHLVVEKAPGQPGPEAAARRGASPAAGTRQILVIDAATGDRLWEKSDAQTAQLMPNTLAVSDGRLFFQNTREIVCLDAKTGQSVWQAARPASAKRPGFSSPTLVIHDGVVLSADRASPEEIKKDPSKVHERPWVDAPVGELIALSATTGQRLWSTECLECFNAPVDVLVADGLVWSGRLAVSGEPGITVGRDPRTGEIKKERPADQEFFNIGMPHHRCHRNRATDRFLVLGRAGIEFIDLDSGRALPNHWIRGTCQYGSLPCNGLLYVPPHSCACYTQAKLNGFLALAPKRNSGSDISGSDDNHANRLERGPAYGKTGRQESTRDNTLDWPTYRHDAARSGYTKQTVRSDLKQAWRTHLKGTPTAPVIAEETVFIATVDDHTVHALGAADGKRLWRYTAGGRVDSPPTIHKGTALFGSADGYAYCLRVSDGQLVWRFRAGPEDRRVVSYGQLESVWPIHGNVLVDTDVAYFAAGRSSYLDGGIYLYRLDPLTGRMLSETRVDSRDPETGYQAKGAIEMFDMLGARPDVLSSDGRFVYMRHTKFDRRGIQQAEGGLHLFCPTGFLDDSWWHRSYWILGSRFHTGYRDWFRPGREVPAGRILAFNESTVYGFARKPEYYYWTTPQEYHLFASAREPKLVQSPKKNPRVPGWGQKQIEYDWSAEIPFQARAMVLADRTLLVAGVPDVLDEHQALNRSSDPQIRQKLDRQVAALEGQAGAIFWSVSAGDGKKIAQYSLPNSPVWDSMAVAAGRVYLTTTDGVLCYGGEW